MKLRYTKSQKLEVSRLARKLAKCKSFAMRRKLIRSLGFKYLGEGVYKEVFGKDDCWFVVKLYKKHNGWENDSYKTPRYIDKYYLHPIICHKQFHIQTKVIAGEDYYDMIESRRFKRVPRRIRDGWDNDIYEENLGILGKREVIIDFLN